MAEHQDTDALNLGTLIAMLRRRWYALLLIVLVPGAALAFSLAEEEKYTAKASVLFRDSSGGLASSDPEREAASNVELLSLAAIEDRVERSLGGPGRVAEEIAVVQEGQSNVLSIEATDPNARVAARTANAYAAAYIAFRRASELRGITSELRFLRQELERGNGDPAVLTQDIRRLSAEQARGGSDAARIVSEAAPPDSPSSPKPVRNTAIGLVIGLLLAGIAVLLLERLDSRLRTPKEAEAALERPVLGLVRRSRDLTHPVAASIPVSGFDDFLALRSYLPYMSSNGDEVRSVLVTSGAPGDGKTTVAWNLAAAAASPDARVLLVEGDLRNPTLADALGVKPERGLAHVLAGTAKIEEVIEEVAVKNADDGATPARVIEVVFAGARAQPDQSAWERVGTLIESLEATYDLIVIDTPPLVAVPDAVPLLPHVDGVIVIGRLGNTPRAALVRLKEQLATVDAQSVGLVVNAVDAEPGYGYGYPGST